MKKEIIIKKLLSITVTVAITVAITVTITTILIAIIKLTTKKIKPAFDKIKVVNDILINSEVLINNDTLEIINTDWINASVILENGVSYHYKYSG